MSNSDPPVSESRQRWLTDFEKLIQEYEISYKIIYSRCPPGSAYLWRADLTVLKYACSGFGDSQMFAKASAVNTAFHWFERQEESFLRRRVQSAQFGAVRAEHGARNESAALRALQEPTFKRPTWFESARQATPEEDKRGIDIVITTTDVGLLFLQVKSSRVFALEFTDKRRATLIGVIVVSHTEDLREVNDRAMEVLLRLHERVLAKRGHSSCG